MKSAPCQARFESGIFERTRASQELKAETEVRCALARLDVLDQRLAADVSAVHAVSPAVGLVLSCLRLQLLVAAERLLVMVSRDSADPDAAVAARCLLVAYKNAIVDASSAAIRLGVLPHAA
jgi:hypothetical protein